MSKTLKFRLWTKSWSNDLSVEEKEPKWAMSEPFGIYEAEQMLNPWVDEIIMQFTGLKDRDGQEIYEGDIVRDQDKWGHMTVVKPIGWHECDAFDVYGYDPNTFGSFHSEDHGMNNVKIMGNIYQNPELVKHL